MDKQELIADRFELGHLIGEGGIGGVYLGQDIETGTPVAIKLLKPEIITQAPEMVERFRQEDKILRELNHPNIVKVQAAIEERDRHFIIMEYASEGSLADLLRNHPQLPLARALSIAQEVTDALARAHHLNIIHGNIKPGNILLAEGGRPRLSDFGLAYLGNWLPETEFANVIGTYQYLSPEGCDGQTLDQRADVWSLGVTIFEMLAGEAPFGAGGLPGAIISAIKEEPVPSLTQYRPDVPLALEQLINQMLAKNREARLSSMRLVGAELEAIVHSLDKPPLAGEPSPVAGAPQVQSGLATEGPLVEEWHSVEETTGEPQSDSSRSNDKITIIIVDDHAIVRRGLRSLLELQDDIEIVGEGANGREAVEQANLLKPDVVLLDLVMPEMDGIEATGKIMACSPQSRVLILTSFGEDDKVFPAIRAGAQGYLLKDIPPDELVQTIREAHSGKAQLYPGFADKPAVEAATDAE